MPGCSPPNSHIFHSKPRRMDSVRTLPFSPSSRRPGLDGLRAVATVGVVILHAAVPYTVAPMPDLTWPVRHPAPSQVVDATFWGIEGLIMPLFLLLSGYGAASSLAKQPGEFLSSRWRRLGWPLIGAACVLLPLELYIWLVGWAIDGQIPWTKLRSLKLGPYHEHLWGLSHLWYLEYLLIYSALLWAGQRALPSRWKSFAADLCSQRLMLLGLGAEILWFAPEVVVGFQHGFLPFPAKFAYSGLFFATGAAIASRKPEALARNAQKSFLTSASGSLALCGILLISLLPLIHQQASQGLIGRERAILAVGLAAYAVLSTRAIWDRAWNFRGTNSRAIERLTQASFWIYLVHHPLVAIGHIALRPTGWPALVQCGLVTVGTLAISLATYEQLVRGTWLGAFLDGVKPVPVQPATPATIPQRRAA